MDFVVFENQNQKYALKSAVVREILDLLPVTIVPFAPSYVEGLVNAGGDIILQISFEKRIQGHHDHHITFENTSHTKDHQQGHLLIIRSEKGLFALKVEQVLEKISIHEDNILNFSSHQINNNQFPNPHPCHTEVIGEINLNGSILLVVDELALGLETTLSTFEAIEAESHFLEQLAQTHQQEESNIRLCGCLIVQASHEYFAFRLQDVLEIVKLQIDRDVTHLPHAPQEIHGLFLLRGIALACFSLGKLFHIQSTCHEKFGIIVATPRGRIVLCAEKLHGIHYYNMNDIQNPITEENHFLGWIHGPLDEMVGLIDIQTFVNDTFLNLYQDYLVDNHIHHHPTEVVEKKKFLSFWMGSELFCLDLSLIHQVAERHYETPLPRDLIDEHSNKKNIFINGVTQLQGIIVPVINLKDILSNRDQEESTTLSQQHYIIVRCQNNLFALLVDRVDCVVDIAPEDLNYHHKNDHDFIAGVGKVNQHLMAIVSLDPLYTIELEDNLSQPEVHS